jgi:hypothetical protein
MAKAKNRRFDRNRTDFFFIYFLIERTVMEISTNFTITSLNLFFFLKKDNLNNKKSRKLIIYLIL